MACKNSLFFSLASYQIIAAEILVQIFLLSDNFDPVA